MPYICNSPELRLDGGRIARKGELVPEADSWPVHIQRVNVRLGHLRPLDPKGTPDDWFAPKKEVIGVVVTDRPVPPWLARMAAYGNANARVTPGPAMAVEVNPQLLKSAPSAHAGDARDFDTSGAAKPEGAPPPPAEDFELPPELVGEEDEPPPPPKPAKPKKRPGGRPKKRRG